MTVARRLIRIHRMETIRDEMLGFFAAALTEELTQQIVQRSTAAARRQRRRSWRGIFRRMAGRAEE